MEKEKIVMKIPADIVCGTNEQITLANWIKTLATVLYDLKLKIASFHC